MNTLDGDNLAHDHLEGTMMSTKLMLICKMVDDSHDDSFLQCLLDFRTDLEGLEWLEVFIDNLLLVDPEVGMLEADLEQLRVHVLEILDHDALGIRVATFESLDTLFCPGSAAALLQAGSANTGQGRLHPPILHRSCWGHTSSTSWCRPISKRCRWYCAAMCQP